MKAMYKGKKVKVVKLILGKSEFIAKPILIQVKIEYKLDGDFFDEYVDANELEFIN
jgi:hypothetical protein